jgi:hypothetical protein
MFPTCLTNTNSTAWSDRGRSGHYGRDCGMVSGLPLVKMPLNITAANRASFSALLKPVQVFLATSHFVPAAAVGTGESIDGIVLNHATRAALPAELFSTTDLAEGADQLRFAGTRRLALKLGLPLKSFSTLERRQLERIAGGETASLTEQFNEEGGAGENGGDPGTRTPKLSTRVEADGGEPRIAPDTIWTMKPAALQKASASGSLASFETDATSRSVADLAKLDEMR